MTKHPALLTALALLLPAARAAAQPGNDDPPPPTAVTETQATAAKTPAQPQKPPVPERARGAVWLGLSLGSGYGWHPQGDLETRSDLSVDSGFAGSGLGYLAPEVGWQYSDDLAFALQGRSQLIPKKDTDPTHLGSPHQWAHTVLARVVYRFHLERLQPFVSGALGAGEGFRFRIDPLPSKRLESSDTVRGGPIVLGPGAGVVWPLGRKLSAVGELRWLIGTPAMATIAELNLGVQYDAF